MSMDTIETGPASLRIGAIRICGSGRTDWGREDVGAVFGLPLNDLLYAAQWVHRQHFEPNSIQVSTLLSIKTGGCPEDCAYCPQSIRYRTDVEAENMLSVDEVRRAAEAAKAAGASRFCMGAAFRGPKDAQVEAITDMIREVKALGLETCATLGLLTGPQAKRLAGAGLDYYNHNLDTSEAFYPAIVSTRTYADRLRTLDHVRSAGMRVCCGGILGMGESREDRVVLLHTLAGLRPQPESVPINQLVPVAGTPLGNMNSVDGLEFVRTVAVARILMPAAHVRLSAGRSAFSDELQALCFAAGANSIFYGETLLTTENSQPAADRALFSRLGLQPEAVEHSSGAEAPGFGPPDG